MNLPQAALQELSPVTCYGEKKGNMKLLCLSRRDSPLPKLSTCGRCAPPCLEPLGLPAAWQPAVKDAAFEVSVCPASFVMAAPCPLLKGRIGATPRPALKLGIMPQLHGAGSSGSGQKRGLEPGIR